MTEGTRSDGVSSGATGHDRGPGRKLVVAGWMMFLASWILPAAKITGPVLSASTTLPGHSEWLLGWQAAHITWRLLTSMLTEASDDHSWRSRVLSITVVTSVVMLLSLVRFSARRTNVCVGIALLACAILNTSWLYLFGDEERPTYMPGYYCWMASFALAGMGMLMRRRSPA